MVKSKHEEGGSCVEGRRGKKAKRRGFALYLRRSSSSRSHTLTIPHPHSRQVAHGLHVHQCLPYSLPLSRGGFSLLLSPSFSPFPLRRHWSFPVNMGRYPCATMSICCVSPNPYCGSTTLPTGPRFLMQAWVIQCNLALPHGCDLLPL